MIHIQIATDNAAFEDCPELELARILRELADKLERGGLPADNSKQNVRDANGNTVGVLEVKP